MALVLLLSAGCVTAHGKHEKRGNAGETEGQVPSSERSPGPSESASQLQGMWRAELGSPGGPLPFGLRIEEVKEGGRAVLRAVGLNGEEKVAFELRHEGEQVGFRIARYDSEILAKLSSDGERLDGEWSKAAEGGGRSRLPFVAKKGEGPRFSRKPNEAIEGAPARIEGEWRVRFRDGEDSSYPARGIFEQQGALVFGTFLTETGDFRYLEGIYEGGLLQLSCFDGAHAFLFQAKADATGELKGDFWSRDSYHATWTAQRIGPGEGDGLRDPYTMSKLSGKGERFRFSFPDRQGKIVSEKDPRFANKVVLIELFGSWCPNCNDQAPWLAKWHERYKERGLEVVGIAFEFGGEPRRDWETLVKYAEHYGIEFPLLLGGGSDKGEASELLPDLEELIAYPTTIFVGRDGKVRRVLTGFSGPGTGALHDRLIAETEALIESLLAEPVDPSQE